METDTTSLSIPTIPPPDVTPSQTNPATLLTSFSGDFDVKHEETDATQARHPAQKSITQPQPTNEQKILSLLRHSILPFSDRLDPFAALPIALDRFQEHLVTFYLLHYPKVTYGLSPLLSPHPVATNFSIALTTPACFHVALARSALYRLSLSKYAGDAEKKSLELAMMRHKGEAIKQVRLLNSRPPYPARKDDLIASMISLGTLDRRTGDTSTSGMHYKAVRRMLKASGGPLAVQSLLLSRVMVFFECIYGTSPESYIWDHPSDLKGLTFQLNNFLAETWKCWVHVSKHHNILGPLSTQESESTGKQRFYLKPGTPLHTILTRSPIPSNEQQQQPTSLQRLELMNQLTCLLTLTALFLDHLPTQRYAKLTLTITDLERSIAALCPRTPSPASHNTSSTSSSTSDSDHAPTTKKQRDATEASSSSYRSNTSRTRTSQHHQPTKPSTTAADDPTSSPPKSPPPQQSTTTNTTTHAPPQTSTTSTTTTSTSTNAANIMWTLHITDPSREHTRRIWAAAGYAWVVKHLGVNMQVRFKEWLVRFLVGRSVFAAEGAEEGEGEEDDACGALGGEVGGGERGGGATGSKMEREDVMTRKKEEKRFREKPLALDAWAFSYAS
jgi:hypothetical protein